MSDRAAVLVVLSGLPGVGKTTLARRLAVAIGGVHVRLDTIEATLNASGVIEAAGGWDAFPGVGYRLAAAVARDHLRGGHDVVGDSVNPLAVTRELWHDCAAAAGALCLDVEVVCGDSAVHRSRVESRVSDLEGLVVPTWHRVEEREYHAWTPPILRVDTVDGVDRPVELIVEALDALR